MLQPGEIGKLEIVAIDKNSAWLDNTGEIIEIGLSDLSHHHKEGDEIEVFIYPGEELSIKATTQLPIISKGKIACLKIKNVHKDMGFVNIAPEMDVVVPPEEQPNQISEGRYELLTLLYDSGRHRLILSCVLRHIKDEISDELKPSDAVSLIIGEKIQAGRKVIINNKYWGVLPSQEMVFRIRKGEIVKGWIAKTERNSYFVSIQPPQKERIEKAQLRIIDLLKQHKGYARITEATPSEDINMRLRMSKKTYREAVKVLQDKGDVIVTKRGIKLNKDKFPLN